jgi:hypothetical protein
MSCSDDDGNAPLEEQQTAKTSIISNAVLTSGRQSGLTLETMEINIEEIELEFDDDGIDYDGDGDDDDYYDEIELDGPFELNFNAAGTTIPLGDFDIPVANYEEIEFEIAKGRNPDSDLFGKSIRITGLLNDVPFVFWHDFEEEVEVDFEDAQTDINIQNDGQSIIINFDLSILFNNNVLDLSQAQDGNNDGLIEISPEDPDGNQSLANEIKELIKENIDLLDD